MGQIIGLKAVHAGNPLPKGVKDAEAADLMKAFTKISQPYNGGVSTNFAIPSSNDFYREGEADPFLLCNRRNDRHKRSYLECRRF